MPQYLHITNGDSAASVIKACGVGGDVLPWRDPMHHGPFPSGLTLDERSRIRIDYLNGAVFSPMGKGRNSEPHGFSARDSMLASFNQYQEVVLWFEHDLLDQLQILQLLDWFSQVEVSRLRLSLICIDQFDGIPNFRGIGQLNNQQMAALLQLRQPVTQTQFDTAQEYWSAFCASEPQTLLSRMQSNVASDNNVFPFLIAALMRHCQEYPWINDGLTRTERQLLKLVHRGCVKPQQTFLDNMDEESCLYIGDWRTYSQLAGLCAPEFPLLACVSGARFLHPNNSAISNAEFNEQTLFLTELGLRAINESARSDIVPARDCWLGGVHLNSNKTTWLWDDEKIAFCSHTKKAD